MADLDKTIQVAINGEDHLSKKLRKIDNKLDKFGSSLGGVAGAAGKAAVAIGAVSAAITGSMVAGLAQAYQEAGTLEEAMLDLEKVVGDQPKKLEEAKQAAIDLSNEYAMSTEDILSAMTNWKQAGYDVADATKIVNDQLDLMIAGDMDAAQATDAMTKAMKGFSLEAEDATRVVDTINAISNNFATNSQKLADALGKVAPTADQMNLSLEEMAGLMTPIIEDFQRGREAGNAFEKILLRLKDDAKPVEEAFAAMGLEDFNRQMASGKEILYKVAENFQDLNKGQKTFVAQQLAGKEHSGKFLSVMNDFPTALKATEKALDDTGTASAEADRKMQGIKHTTGQIQTAFANLGATVGEQFDDPVTNALKGVHEILVTLEEAISKGAMEEFFKEIRDMSQDLADYLSEVADVLPQALEDVDYSGLADSVREVGDSFRHWFDGLDLTEPEELAQALQKLVDTMDKSVSTFAKFNTAIAKTVDFTRTWYNAGQVMVNFIKGTWLTTIEGLSEALALIPVDGFQEFNKEMEKIKGQSWKSFNKNIDQTKKAFDDLKNSVNETPDSKQVNVSQTGAENVQQAMSSFREYEDVNVNVDDNDTAKKTGKEIDENVPKERKMEIEAELEKERIEAQAEKVQQAMKMTAEVETTRAETQMEKFKSVVEGTTASIKNTSKQMGQIFDYLSDPGAIMDPSHMRDVEDMLEDEHESRQKLLKKQAKLADKQIKMMQERIDSMQNGEGMFTIQSDGLEPELEAFMWKIIEKVQVRANEEASEFLLGI